MSRAFGLSDKRHLVFSCNEIASTQAVGLDDDDPAGRFDDEDDPILLRLVQLKRGGLVAPAGGQAQAQRAGEEEGGVEQVGVAGVGGEEVDEDEARDRNREGGRQETHVHHEERPEAAGRHAQLVGHGGLQ